MKKLIYTLPEYYLLILVVLAGYSPPYYVNTIFIGIAFILVLQIIFKNKISGIIISMLFFLANLYFLGAVLSEFNEFEVFNRKAQKLLLVGLSIWVANLLFSLTMVLKYTTNVFSGNSESNLEQQTV
tara:strand:+ start:37 stop:417 length:381 start_codon:yes stop_codon:yes gene_type:complete